MARELDDAILTLRTNELDIGTWLLKTEGDAAAVLAGDATMLAHAGPLVRARDDRPAAPHLRAARRLVAHAVRADRAGLVLRRHARSSSRSPPTAPTCSRCPTTPRARRSSQLDALNFGALPDGQRPVAPGAPLLRRGGAAATRAARRASARPLDADDALALGLVTAAPDDIDWDDEIRIALEERAALSPDALTGMEANLRFAGKETWRRAIFGRLTAWQNWIFRARTRSATKGALKVYGTRREGRLRFHRV